MVGRLTIRQIGHVRRNGHRDAVRESARAEVLGREGQRATGQKWSGWLTAPNKLSRAGWNRKTLNPGDKIVVSGTPHKDGSHVLQIRKLVGPEGNALPLSEN